MFSRGKAFQHWQGWGYLTCCDSQPPTQSCLRPSHFFQTSTKKRERSYLFRVQQQFLHTDPYNEMLKILRIKAWRTPQYCVCTCFTASSYCLVRYFAVGTTAIPSTTGENCLESFPKGLSDWKNGNETQSSGTSSDGLPKPPARLLLYAAISQAHSGFFQGKVHFGKLHLLDKVLHNRQKPWWPNYCRDGWW